MIQISSLLGNSQKLDGGAMFGNAPRALWQKWSPPDELGRIALNCRCLLIEINGSKILCETGIGAFFEPKMSERFGVQNPDQHMLLKELENLNIKAEDIDVIVLSHLHFDHAGGLLSAYNKNEKSHLVFKNAEIWMSDLALERALKPHPRDKASFVSDIIQAIEQHPKKRIIKMNEKVLEFDSRFEFSITNGHTPGHMHTLFHGSHESIYFCGDLIPGLAWVNSAITMGYDRYPELLIDEKNEMYHQALKKDWWLFYTHDNQFARSKIQKNEKQQIQYVSEQVDFKRLNF